MKVIVSGILLSLLAVNAGANLYKDSSYQKLSNNNGSLSASQANDNPFDSFMTKTKDDYLAKREVELRAEREYRAQLAKKPNATIGMSKTQVLNKTNWGKPKYTNKTTNAYGTREQWVYDDYQYLYFDNGKLTTIQQ